MSIPNRNRVVEIAHSFSRSLQLQHLYQLVFHPPSSEMIGKVGHQVLSIRGVFQAPEPTQLVQSVVRTIRANALQERKNVLGVVSLVTG